MFNKLYLKLFSNLYIKQYDNLNKVLLIRFSIMQNKIIILKGMIFRDKDYNKFYAVCLTTNHIVRANSAPEAMNKLVDQLNSYTKSVLEYKNSDLTLKDLKRPTPLVFWYKYYIALMLSLPIRLAHFANDSFSIFNQSVDSHNAKICPV